MGCEGDREIERGDAEATEQDAVEFEYELTMEAYLRATTDRALAEDYLVYARQYRRRFLFTSIGWTVFGVSAFGAMLSFSGGYQELLFHIGVILGFILLILAGVFLWIGLPISRHRVAVARSVIEQARAQVGPHMFEKKRLRADHDGIEWGGSLKTFRAAWPAVIGVDEHGGYLAICFDDGSGPIIPVDQVKPGEVGALKDLVARFAGGDDAEAKMIARVLRGRSFACPGCGYDCQGAGANVCPECGRTITAADFQVSKKVAAEIASEACRAAGFKVSKSFTMTG